MTLAAAAPALLAAATTVTLTPGQSIQAAVTAAPPGTTFVLQAGVYRMQSVQPKAHDVFQAQGAAILNGSQVLTFQSDPAGSGLFISSATPAQPDAGQCQTAYPLCNYTQDVFLDNVLQATASSPVGLQPGSWYFDRIKGVVYLPADPTGHVVEMGSTQFAFYGDPNAVQIQGIVVEKYANPAQTGAIGAYKNGNGWTVSNVEARFNHGTGISLGPNSSILNRLEHHKGQMGVGIVGGNSSKVTGNEIAWNNYAGYALNWEAGGSKFWSTTNLLVANNYSHDNNGNGLWTDHDNINTTYENNTIINNSAMGIEHEISYKATITGNTLRNNGNAPNYVFNTAQILLSNSQNSNVYANTIEVGANGGDAIGLFNEVRGTGSQGIWRAANNYVHNNDITYDGPTGSTGLLDYAGNATGNTFDYNQYHLKAAGTVHWMWVKAKMSWALMQAQKQETHGSCCN